LITGSLPNQTLSFIFLVLASSCLYCAGMVWNDYFDYEQDLKERPFRPLPSQRVTRGTAVLLGVVLFGAGIAFALLAGMFGDEFQSAPLVVAVLLVLAILLYDAWLKRTFLGPVSMGSCRFLNVLLGLTVAAGGIPSWGFVLALVVGVYIVGVTWFARKEARLSRQLELAAAALVMLTALPLALFLPALGRQLARGETFGQIGHLLFPYMLVAFGFWVGIPAAAAIHNPAPKYVQAGVKRAIIGLVVLDAVLATSLAGTVGLLVLVLLLPAMWLGKWVYST
jgi:4-hydroxybenzoate polyprenyltransferase